MPSRICRLCVDSQADTVDIFNNSQVEDLDAKIHKLFLFWVKQSDSSTAICVGCIRRVNDFHSFYVKVINAQVNFSKETCTNPEISSDKNILNDAFDYLAGYQNYEAQVISEQQPVAQKNIFKNFNSIIKEEECIVNSDCLELLIGHDVPVVFSEDHIKSDIEDYQDEKLHLSAKDNDSNPDFDFDSDDNLLTYKRHQLVLDSKNDRKRKKKLHSLKKLDKSSLKKRKTSKRKGNSGEITSENLLNSNPNFPPEIIKDGKLIIKGNLLDKLISNFFQIKCELCSGTPKFRNLNRLMAHFDVVHETKGYLTCCNTRLHHHRTIYMHMARHLQPSAFECPICKKVVSRPHSLKLHMQTHLPESEKPHKCDECDRRFSYIEGLASHKLTHVPVEERETINCKICGKRFTLAASFSTHMRAVHSGAKYLCSECGRSFQRKTELTFHMLTHDTTGKNKVQCQQCGFMCKNPPTLKIHMKRHAAERLHCSICEYTTHRQQQLNVHMRVKHSDERPYVCVVCGKQFKLKSVLRTHMAQHTGEQKFMCIFCPKTFASPGNYHSHRKRMHADEHKNEIDMKRRERFKNIVQTESKDLKVDEEHVHELAREYLKKIADQNASKK